MCENERRRFSSDIRYVPETRFSWRRPSRGRMVGRVAMQFARSTLV
jgi:hypothetical protein